MTRTTPDEFGLPAPSGTNPVLTSDDIWALALKAAEGLASVKSGMGAYQMRNPVVIDAVGSTIPLTPEGLEALPSGNYATRFGASSEALGLPFAVAGTVDIIRWGTGSGLMRAVSREVFPQIYEQALLSGGWADWVRVDAGASEGEADPVRLRPASSSSLKSTALAFSTGYSGERFSGAGTTSVIQRLPSSALRGQALARNWNPRYGTEDRAPVTLTNVRVGLHVGGGAGSGWVPLGAGPTAFESRWINFPESWRGQEVVIEYTWSGTDVTRCLGTGWTDGVSDQRPPLFVWMKVEVPASTPVVGVFGSSTAAGVGTLRPLIDSWLSLWAANNGAVPMFWAHSGDSAINWGEGMDRKWELYGTDIAAPDAMIYANALNDWGSGATLGELQARILSNVEQIHKRITPVVYGATITPRIPIPANDNTRVQLNAWMPVSGLFRDVFDFATAVALPDGTLNPAFNADGTHMNDAGHEQLEGSISRPIVA